MHECSHFSCELKEHLSLSTFQVKSGGNLRAKNKLHFQIVSYKKVPKRKPLTNISRKETFTTTKNPNFMKLNAYQNTTKGSKKGQSCHSFSALQLELW